MLAFVVISIKVGTEENVIKSLKKIGYVKETIPVFGPYDLIAKIETQNHEDLQKCLSSIKQLDHIRSTLTLQTTKAAYEN